MRGKLSGIVVQEMVRPVPLLCSAKESYVREDFFEAILRRLIPNMYIVLIQSPPVEEAG